MKPIWKTAFAVLLAVGALMGITAASQAAGAGETSRSESLALGTTAYHVHNAHCRKRHHARRHYRKRHRARHHRARRHGYHRSHRRHYSGGHGYSRHIHGPRYRTRRVGYTYQYAGYWYAQRWWVPVRADSYGGGHLSHADWCYEQYGDYYDPRSNTYQASDGYSYRCIRPQRW